MSAANISINLKKLSENARFVSTLCADSGISVSGVTKAAFGMPHVAQAMLDGGVSGIGESRLESITRLRSNGIACPSMLLRIPPMSEARDVVAIADVSLNSEIDAIRELSAQAHLMGRVHDIIIMVELGDLREGVRPQNLLSFCEEVAEFDGVRIAGLGTNLMCFGGVIPSELNMGKLVDCAELIENRLGLSLDYLSGGNSSALPMVARGEMPQAINHLRIGFSILLGRNALNNEPWPGMHQDVFVIESELIECKVKPSVPEGTVGIDAFGNRPVHEEKGERIRGIASLGRVDTDVSGLVPTDSRLNIVGASSDHLILDMSAMETLPAIGEKVFFIPEYSALVPMMVSPYIDKRPVADNTNTTASAGVTIVADSNTLKLVEEHGFVLSMEKQGYKITTGEIGLSRSREEVSLIGQIERLVEQAVQSDKTPLVIGNTRVSVGAAASGISTVRQRLGVIWLDSRACLDKCVNGDRAFNEHEDSGALVTVLESNADTDDTSNSVIAENVVLVGLQDVLDSEAALLRRGPISTYTMEDVDLHGITHVMRKAIDTASAGTDGILLSFNTSVVGQQYGIHHGGLSYRECCHAMELLASSKKVVGVCLSGIGPEMEHSEMKHQFNYLLTCFGKRIL